MAAGNWETFRVVVAERLRQSAAARLRGVCGEWSADLFGQLIDDIVAIEMKYRDRAHRELFEAAAALRDRRQDPFS